VHLNTLRFWSESLFYVYLNRAKLVGCYQQEHYLKAKIGKKILLCIVKYIFVSVCAGENTSKARGISLPNKTQVRTYNILYSVALR
jgi:hypothetical protein